MNWNDYFMAFAYTAAIKSSCIKRQVGAVIVNDNRIIATGYNGTPIGVANCNQGGCSRCNDPLILSGTRLDECWCNHAEENCILQCARHGISPKGAALYTTLSPCLTCAKMIINAGIRAVIYSGDYLQKSAELLKQGNVELVRYEGDR